MKKIRVILVFLSFYIIFANSILIDPSISASSSNTIYKLNGEIGHFNSTDARKVDVIGEYAFIAGGSSGLQVVDISNVSDPEFIVQYSTPGDVVDLEISGNIGYLAATDDIRVVDISNPESPQSIVWWSDGSNEVSILEVCGDILYAVFNGNIIRALNISKPDIIQEINFTTTSGTITRMKAVGNVLYVADGAWGFRSINITNPLDNMEELDWVATVGEAVDFVIDGNVAYIAVENTAIRSVNITDPTNMNDLDVFSGVDPSCLEIYGDYLYVGEELDGLKVVYIWDPTNITITYTPALPSGIWMSPIDLEIVGDTMYAINNHQPETNTIGGLRTIKISSPRTTIYQSGYYQSGNLDFNAIDIEGDVIYIAESQDGLVSISKIDNTDPSVWGSLNLPDSSLTLAIDGNIAYIGDNNTPGGLTSIDITNSKSPVILDTYYTTGQVNSIDIEGNIAYVSDGTSGLITFDITDPKNLIPLGYYSNGTLLSDVIVEGNTAYLAYKGKGFLCINVTDPTNPTYLGSYTNINNITDIEIDGDIAYLTDDQNGFNVLDISNPLNPTSITHMDTGAPGYSVKVSGNVLFFGTGNNIVTYDIENSLFPTQIDSFETVGNIMGMDIAGDQLYCAIKGQGMIIFCVRTSGGDDFDGDRLDFWTEVWQYYTDPFLLDSDSDGLDDWEEVNEGNDGFFTDPNNPDTDGDGIIDSLDDDPLHDPGNNNGIPPGLIGIIASVSIGIVFVIIIIKAIKGKKNRLEKLDKGNNENKFLSGIGDNRI